MSGASFRARAGIDSLEPGPCSRCTGAGFSPPLGKSDLAWLQGIANSGRAAEIAQRSED